MVDSEDVYLYLVKADTLPESIFDDLLIFVDDGVELDSYTESFSSNNVRYLSSLLISSCRSEDVINNFKEWWKSNVDGDIDLECLAVDRNQLSRSNLDKLQSMESEGWVLSASFIGYYSNSFDGYMNARQIIVESDLLIQ